MTVLSYPGFVEGQILTRDDLNGLRDYLRDRDSTLGRVVGFGIAGGLVGEVRTDGLHIGAGLAVDQAGQALMLPADQTLPLPPQPDEIPHGDGEVPYGDLVDPAAGGFSVVLVATDTTQAAQPCNEDGCGGHSEVHTTGVDLLVVPGRLIPYGTDFSQEELLNAVPLTVTDTGGVSGSVVGLRDQILARVGDLLPQLTRQKLAELTIAGDKNAVAVAKAAFVNEVLFATLDLLRFQALMDRAVFLDADRPGVVLGWVHAAGGGWAWDCSYRHVWEPQTGVALALFGDTCGDPALPWLQRLQALIDTFVPPTIPDDDKPPVVVDPPFICRGYRKFVHVDCGVRVYPPVELPPDWWKKWTVVPDWGDNPLKIPQPVDPVDVYRIDTPDPVDYGVIDLVGVLGSRATDTRGMLVDLVGSSGVTQPGVEILSASQARDLPGFAFDGMAGPADTIVLIANDAGRVVGTGRVAHGQSVKNLGTQLPAAVNAAAEASQQAATALQRYDGVAGNVTELQTKFADLGNTYVTRSAFEGVERQLGGLDSLVQQKVEVQVAAYSSQVNTQLPNLVGAAFATYQDQVKETSELARNLAGQNEVAMKQLQQLNGRIDVLYSGGRGLGTKELAVSDSLTSVFRAMRESVAATAPPDRRGVVEARLAGVDQGLERLGAVTAAGGSPLIDSPETLTGVVDSLAAGLAEAGAPQASIRALTTQINALRRALEG